MDIAKELHLDGCDNPEIDQLDLVRSWLRNENATHLLVILDNVDDKRLVTPVHDGDKIGESNFSIMKYISQRPNIMVLATSRDSQAAFDLVNQ